MKVIGYSPIHYGKEYLKESLLSAIDLCEQFVILYTPNPSYGYGTNVKCPDTEEELKTIAEEVCGNKLIWVSKDYHSEGDHRKEIFKYTKGYDLLLTMDADEVWNTEELKKGLEIANVGVHRNYGINGYVNLFRNFDNQCKDGFQPVRVINLRNQHKDQSTLNITIWHFGCCQAKEIMDYKYLIHGHKDELRTDWLKDFYYSDREKDLHPVAHNLWNLTPYDKYEMPKSLKEHANFNKKRV